MIEKIHDSIHELLADGCKRENLIICYSPLVGRYIEQEAYTQYPFTACSAEFTKFTKLEGVDISNIWPYNEIVVYDVVGVCYYPHLIRKISVELPANKNTFVKQ